MPGNIRRRSLQRLNLLHRALADNANGNERPPDSSALTHSFPRNLGRPEQERQQRQATQSPRAPFSKTLTLPSLDS